MLDFPHATMLGYRGTVTPAGTIKSGGPKTPALTCRLLLFDQATEKMPRPPFAPMPTSVFCTSV